MNTLQLIPKIKTQIKLPIYCFAMCECNVVDRWRVDRNLKNSRWPLNEDSALFIVENVAQYSDIRIFMWGNAVSYKYINEKRVCNYKAPFLRLGAPLIMARASIIINNI